MFALAKPLFSQPPAPTPSPASASISFPLTVDYREYTYAGGRIPGGFIKREGRMSEREILTSRQIDRPIRPLFPEGFRSETQVIAFVLSADTENDPDVAGINGASVALTHSPIFRLPVRLARCASAWSTTNSSSTPPTSEQRESKVNIMVVGTAEGIVMIEAGASEVEEDRVVDAIEFGHGEIKKICATISEFAQKVGRAEACVRSSGDRPGIPQRAARQGWRSAGRCGQHRKVHQDRQLLEDQGAEGQREG